MSRLFSSWRDAAEVIAEGAARRSEVPVEDLARYEPAATGPTRSKLIEATNDDRVPDLIPLRYQRMAEIPFTFLRGAATVMAHDIAARRQHRLRSGTSAATHTRPTSASTPRRSAG